MSGPEVVVREALHHIVPSDAEAKKLHVLTELLLEKTRNAAMANPEVKDVLVGGSFAKGTWLPGQADIDIFLKIDPATSEVRFEQIGLKVGASAMRGYPRGKKYAQHPYTEATVEGTKVNIVPCYDVVQGQWKSAADRSPFHVELVSKIPCEQKNQVRLLKRFMRATGIYGAEIEVQGFSGYAAEVLVMQHGDLLGVLRSFVDLKRESDEKLFRLPDPVDRTRDLGLAISGEKLARMVLASREFLSNPTSAYFAVKRGKSRPVMRGAVIAVVFSHVKLSEDTLWGELRRTLKHLRRHLEEKGFKVARAIPASDKSTRSAFLFIPEFDRLPRLEQRVGPTVDRRKETEAFLKANRSRAKLTWVDDDARVRILQEREHTELPRLLAEMTKTGAKGVGASDEVGRGMARSGRVVSGLSLSRMASSAEWLREGIDEIASDTIGTGTP